MSDESSSTHGHKNVNGTIVIIARLDDIIATAMTGLREDKADRAGGHRQNLYHDTFRAFLPVA